MTAYCLEIIQERRQCIDLSNKTDILSRWLFLSFFRL